MGDRITNVLVGEFELLRGEGRQGLVSAIDTSLAIQGVPVMPGRYRITLQRLTGLTGLTHGQASGLAVRWWAGTLPSDETGRLMAWAGDEWGKLSYHMKRALAFAVAGQRVDGGLPLRTRTALANRSFMGPGRWITPAGLAVRWAGKASTSWWPAGHEPEGGPS